MPQERPDKLTIEMNEKYGERGEKAVRLIREGKVRKYLDFYVVIGNTGEYIVEEDFCTCNDFMFRGSDCAHIIAVRLAKKLGCVEEVDEWYQDYI